MESAMLDLLERYDLEQLRRVAMEDKAHGKDVAAMCTEFATMLSGITQINDAEKVTLVGLSMGLLLLGYRFGFEAGFGTKFVHSMSQED